MDCPQNIEIGLPPYSCIIKSNTVFNVRIYPSDESKSGIWKLDIIMSDGKRMPKNIMEAKNFGTLVVTYQNFVSCRADYKMLLMISDHNFAKHAATFSNIV